MTTFNRLKTLATALALASSLGVANGAALSYHGSLQDGGKPADGRYDIELTLYPAQSGGDAVAGPVTLLNVPVHSGSFSTSADFGALAGDLSEAWLGARVRVSGSSQYTSLAERSAASLTAPATCNGTWALDGNVGNPSGSYLGNADNEPLAFKVNGVQLGLLASSSNANSPDAPNVVFGSPSNAIDGAVGGATIAGGGRPVEFCGAGGGSGCSNVIGGSGNYATISGGRSNTAEGYASTVAGGLDNVALGNLTFAAGQGAYAFGEGTFVWADSSSDTAFGSTQAGLGNPNEFDIRATGGFNLVSGTDASGNITAGVRLAPGSGSWSSLSDRNAKSDLLDVKALDVLASVVGLPISTWRYKAQAPEIRHIGPMAQDFHAAFNLGEDERHITEVDEGGVALAAIQGLNEKVESENRLLKAENASLGERLEQLAARLTHVESVRGE